MIVAVYSQEDTGTRRGFIEIWEGNLNRWTCYLPDIEVVATFAGVTACYLFVATAGVVCGYLLMYPTNPILMKLMDLADIYIHFIFDGHPQI